MSSYHRKPLNLPSWMCSLATVGMLWFSHQTPATTFLNLKFVFCLDFDSYPVDDLDAGYGRNKMSASGGGGVIEELSCANGTECLVFVHF